MISDTWLRAKWSGKDEWKKDAGMRGAGRLVAKRRQGGAMFYFQYFHRKERRLLPLGAYDEKGERGLTLRMARDRAHAQSELFRAGTTDLHGHRELLAAEERAKREQEELQRRAAIQARSGTLRELFETYLEHIKPRNWETYLNVRSVFKVHVFDKFPDIAEQRAADVPVSSFVRIIRACIEEGKGRTAAQVRTYMHAAYALAGQSAVDSEAPSEMLAFGIEANPVASIKAVTRFNRARTRTLSAAEMRAFLRRLDAMPLDVKNDAVRLLLSLGGQRPRQMLRLRADQVDLSSRVATLFDSKGRRQTPRVHKLPLTDQAAAILERRIEQRIDTLTVLEVIDRVGIGKTTIYALIGAGEFPEPLHVGKRARVWPEAAVAAWIATRLGTDARSSGPVPSRAKTTNARLFSLDGSTQMGAGTLSDHIREIVQTMLAAREIESAWQLRDLRRTCETMMASLKISSDVRAMILSHGLSGVQKRHYDFHDYAEEMRDALEKWQAHMDHLRTDSPDNVVVVARFGGRRRS